MTLVDRGNITEDLCRICDGTIECAPTALLLVTLIHSLFGYMGDEPDYFGKNKASIPRNRADKGERYGSVDDEKVIVVDDTEYDFIVVGGGTAGCVVASRLSENKNWKVLLIEAGPVEPKLAAIPSLSSQFRGSVLDWKYSMRPKKRFCQNRGHKGCEIVQGRVLGGTSTINDMVYTRGSPADYDEWALDGNEGWSFAQVLPYFKKSERNYDRDISEDTVHHSTQGALDVGRYIYVDRNVDVLLSALGELGYKYTDVNGRHQLGFTRIQTMSYLGERVSTNKAFIDPVKNSRPNLKVVNNAIVTRILFQSINNYVVAVGVECLKNGTHFLIRSTKEVIVSAGAINTPKVLMQSGIGPREYLEYLNIEVISDLPVGSNFHDHLSVCLPIIKLAKTSTMKNFEQKLKDIIKYYVNGTGPLSANFQVVAFYETILSDITGAPDIEFRFRGHDSNMFYDKMDICISLLTPNSRGQIILNATDPISGTPLIYPNFLNHYSDNKKLLEGIQEIVKIFDTEVFKMAGFDFDSSLLLSNECSNHNSVTEAFWMCIIRQFSAPLHNYVGTCKMGAEKDPEAVVDNTLLVYGISNLRVVDASIIPKIPRGSTAASVVMIAEKASDEIKN
ncbi:glucose dehydrogenase [FAD, quinone]-like, partial [Aricia agestis]|uniref:glucose dehydrogenase [FAD, quinone]-like n=1 Tax=Aricia agestis TaxID=91739 RepID=UPI001C20A40D